MVWSGNTHNLFPYSAIIDRPRLTWPNGARVALWVIPNIEHYRLEAFLPDGPDVRNFSRIDYGNRVGIWRLMAVLDRHGIRGTVALNSAVCRHYPRVVEEALRRDWELMGHGVTNSQRLTGLAIDDERALIQECLEEIAAFSGRRPRGWLGPGLSESEHTLDLLREAGVEYVCDWVNDDQPYRMNNGLYSIPYSLELNDMPVFRTPAVAADEFRQMICEAFDVLYAEGADQGRVMAIALHPFLIGAPIRIRALERALDYILQHDQVWVATGAEIIDWYRQQVEAPTAEAAAP